jgi:hypothetical protein
MGSSRRGDAGGGIGRGAAGRTACGPHEALEKIEQEIEALRQRLEEIRQEQQREKDETEEP